MFNFIRYGHERKLINKDIELDEEQRAILEIKINDKTEILSPFYLDKKEVINEEFASFLDNAIKAVPPKKKINIKLTCENMSKDEEEICVKAIRNYYYNKTIDTQRRIKNNSMIFGLMIILSILSLVALFLVEYFNAFWLITEIFDIIAWVFVWEAVDIIAFQRSLIIYERNRHLALYNAKISFDK